ncbi:MAG: insulinase family protein, partial [bacterium]
MYGDAHPYRLNFEDPEDLRAISLDNVRWFHQRWYVPSNATLVLVGDFETARARQWIERYFGSLATVAKPARSSAALSVATP